MPPRKRLGQLLTELGVIDEHQLQSALGHQKQWGGKLGAVLVQRGFCKEPEVVSALSKHLGMPSVKLGEAKVDPRATKFVSRQIAEKLHVFPYEISGSGRSEVVTIAMSDPTDLSAVDQLAFHTGKRIKPILAGDSEIVQAIQQHYSDEKPGKPGAPAPAPAHAAAAPSSSAPQEFPKRVSPPPATPSAAAPRMTPSGGTPYIPPPIPVLAPKPVQKLEEIEPDESMAVPTPSPGRPGPLELPEDDGQMMGLEPIAAHSQFGDQVAGQEDVAGEGSAADAVEGLVSAGVPHEGSAEAAQLEGLEPSGAHPQEPVPEGGWGAESAPAEGWSAEAAAEPEPAAAAESTGWADEAPAAEAAAPAGDFGAAQDWSAGQAHGEGWSAGQEPAAESASAWGAEQPWGAEPPAPEMAGGDGGEQLPMDAILGTAEVAEGAAEAPAWGEPSTEQLVEQAAAAHAAAPPEPAPGHDVAEPEEAPQAEAQEQEAAPSESAEAPDAWADSEDPLAARGEAPAWGEAAAESSGEAAASGMPAQEEPAQEEPAHEEPPGPPEGLPSQEVSPSTDKFALVSAAEETSSESAAAEEPSSESAAAETEAPPEWGEAAEEPAAEAAAEAGAEVEQSEEAPQSEAAELQPAEAPAEEFAEQDELKLEGWVAPPAEAEPQGAGWLGEALEATTPLSAADLGTLASVGVDPNDGVGALRLLAALVRVLHRRQLIEPDEIAAEVRESRAQAAQERAAADAEANGAVAASDPEPSADPQPPAEPAET